ncbi:hypothetical protein ACHAWO_001603 [Cyclotella atomus]|uniref:HMG box domain-containing protein n=1 Tax=Cyclotella atomus TaxID=382360 RepID=A0ABD3P194_9STRA
MSSKPSAAEVDSLEPPYCFRSIKELRKHQTRYNQYNLFHMIERLRLLDSQGVVETIEPIDESSHCYKMYKDFVVPDLPPAYAHLNLPPHWLMFMFVKKEKRRSHKKSNQPLISFKDLAKAIADGYKAIDEDTKAWLDELSGKLLDHNKKARDLLEAYLIEKGIKPEPEHQKIKKVKAAGGPAQAKSPQDVDPEDKDELSAASSRASPPSSRVGLDERRRYHLLKLQAAKLALEMQELQNSMVSPAGLRREDLMMMYPNSGRGAMDQYGISPFVNQLSYPSSLISPAERASWLTMAGRVGLMPPLGIRTRHERNQLEAPGARSQSLLLEEGPPKRKSSNEGEAKRDEKRAKTKSHKTSNENDGNARRQSDSPLEQAQARAASTGNDGFSPPSSGHTALPRDVLTSAFHAPFPGGGLASLGPAGFGGASGSDQLMLGYQLGLQAAAKAHQASASSRNMSHEEMAARLELMGRQGLSSNNSRSDRNDDVAAQLEMLRRRELNRSLDRSGAHAASFGHVGLQMTNDEIASRLESFGRPGSPFSRFGGGDDEIARRVEALRRPGIMNRAEAFARSEFGLSLSDIEGTFNEMKRSRQG